MLSNEYVLAITSGSIEKKIKRDYPIDYAIISNMKVGTNFKEKTYLYLNPIANYQCQTCNKPTKLYRYTTGFLNFCSPQCRGKIPAYKKTSVPNIIKNDVKYWPLKSILINIVKQPNYSKSIIRKEFYEFYCYIHHTFKGKTFNEKLFLYLHNNEKGKCIECNSLTKFDAIIFSYKSFCSRQCANYYNRMHQTGGYNLKYFESHPNEKHTTGYFYFVRLFNENENFIKIGITKREFNIRKNEICGSRYNVEILKIKEMPLYECSKLELKLKTDSKLLKYFPEKKISGKTECFDITEKENIWKII